MDVCIISIERTIKEFRITIVIKTSFQTIITINASIKNRCTTTKKANKMKKIKDIFPNQWKEAIELVEQKHTQACENADNRKWFNKDYLDITKMAKVIMENLATSLQTLFVENTKGDYVPAVKSIDLICNNENELNDHIVMMYYDRDYDEELIASQGIYECIEGSYLELLNEFK